MLRYKEQICQHTVHHDYWLLIKLNVGLQMYKHKLIGIHNASSYDVNISYVEGMLTITNTV